MTLFAVLSLLVLSLAARERPRVRWHLLAVVLLFAAFYALWMQEHLLGRIDYFISDEGYYLNRANDPGFTWEAITTHGFLWIAVNRWMTHVDLVLGVHGLKVLNLPILLAVIIILYRIFNRDGRVLSVPFILPYVVWLALFNMRDVAILLAAVAAIYGLFGEARIRLHFVVPGAIGLILLRPEFFAVLVVACVVASLRGVKGAGASQVARIAIVVLLIGVTVGPALVERILKAIAWVEYSRLINYDAAAAVRLGEYRTSSLVLDGMISMLRYIFAPFPHSLIGRIGIGGQEEWGLVDDIVRLANQVGYYGCLVVLAVRVRRLPALFTMLAPAQLAMLIFLLAYAPVYGIHLFGVAHQRLKVPFQIGVALLAIGVSGWRARARIATERPGERNTAPLTADVAPQAG